ncbi:MAG: DUF883 domain-containing protein [Betaproteobacteria bacterium]|nr:MAG: DUF883 domain-containing protein [Betaproteobacteria bacterium]
MNDTTQATGDNSAGLAPQRDKVMADLRTLIADAEELLRATAGQTGNGASALRDKVSATLERAKVSLADTQAEALARAKAAGQAADRYVHDNPWTAVGAAAGVGLLIGLLLSRR